MTNFKFMDKDYIQRHMEKLYSQEAPALIEIAYQLKRIADKLSQSEGGKN